MPMVDGKYVSPAWQNGESPAINADELNAICSVLAGNEAGMANKAPSGYGLGGYGRTLTSSDDLDTIKSGGWYTWTASTAPANAPEAAGGSMMVMPFYDRSSNPAGAVQIVSIFMSNRTYVRNVNSAATGTWSAWRRCDPGAFAPSDYGLGVGTGGRYSVTPITDLNTAVCNGWYPYAANAANKPSFFTTTGGVVFVLSLLNASTSVYQIAFSNTDTSNIAVRRYNAGAGTWGAWQRCDPAAFAPSGYGLGTRQPETLTDINDTSISNKASFTGIYFCNDLTNSPTGQAGILVVESAFYYGYYIRQTFLAPAGGPAYQRMRTSSSWTAWQRCDPAAFAAAPTTIYDAKTISVAANTGKDTGISLTVPANRPFTCTAIFYAPSSTSTELSVNVSAGSTIPALTSFDKVAGEIWASASLSSPADRNNRTISVTVRSSAASSTAKVWLTGYYL